MNKLHLFATITKVDEVRREVHGRVTAEEVDKANEILDYEGSKPLFAKWSDRFAKTTTAAGQEVSFGNVRAMHKAVAAGKLRALNFDDVGKTIDTVAYISDDAEWKKCLDGTYTGFSMGGQYVRKWKDPKLDGVVRFIADPSEVSLVDNPCVGSATFSLVKADGVAAETRFAVWEPSTADIGKRAEKMAADAKTGGIADYLDAARVALTEEYAAKAIAGEDEPAAEAAGEVVKVEDAPGAPTADLAFDDTLTQVWKVEADGKLFANKADARKHVAALQVLAEAGGPLAKAIAAAKAAAGAADPGAERAPTAAEQPTPLYDAAMALKTLEAANPAIAVEKGMYGLSRFADVLASLADIQVSAAWEANREKDSSPVPAALATAVSAVADQFLAMANEEVAELLASLKTESPETDVVMIGDGPSYACAVRGVDAVKADTALMTKVGARNSAKDAKTIQAMHDHSMALGAKCDAGNCDKAVAPAGSEVVEKLTAQNEALKAQIETALPEIAGFAKLIGDQRAQIDSLTARVEKLSAEPVVPVIHRDTREVTRDGATVDSMTGDPLEMLGKLFDIIPAEKIALAMAKRAQGRPVSVYGGD